ncbi:MAG: hypothetical protein M3N95_10825 [Actinomycetota bacterium]|nr:hypothetical protein [Actinomycetota bacterium]
MTATEGLGDRVARAKETAWQQLSAVDPNQPDADGLMLRIELEGIWRIIAELANNVDAHDPGGAS